MKDRDILFEPLINIFRKYLGIGIVPLIWRNTYIMPIFDKKAKSVMSNYSLIIMT